ncbi:MAG: GNAT family N-acetyltransferase [Clostridiales bacterium]|nr:GNAT family N-acetyltransferase [Clostridiales bacterium]
MDEIRLLKKIDYEKLYTLRRECFPVLTKMQEDFAMNHYYDEINWYGIFLKEILISVIWIKPMELSFNNTKIMAGGIGSVATHPKYRNKGYSKKLINHALSIMVKRGYALTSLAPFLTSFYEKFGYSNTLSFYEVTYKMEQLNYLKQKRQINEDTPSLTSDFVKARVAFSKQYNLYCQRDEKLMASYIQSFKEKEYTIKAINDMGYVIFKEIKNSIFVAEIVYENLTILDQLLAYIYNVHNNMGKLVIITPPDYIIIDYIKSDCENIKLVQDKMSKVLDVKKMLAITNFPDDIAIKVDKELYINRKDQSTITTKDIAIQFTIQGFTQYILGVRSLIELQYTNQVIIKTPKEFPIMKKTLFENEVY